MTDAQDLPLVLAACPWCHRADHLDVAPASAQKETFVHCLACNATGPSSWGHDDNVPYAIAAWNRRSLRAERDAVLEGLVEAAFRLGVSDGLKHGPIAAKWCCTPERARDSIRALKAEGGD